MLAPKVKTEDVGSQSISEFMNVKGEDTDIRVVSQVSQPANSPGGYYAVDCAR